VVIVGSWVRVMVKDKRVGSSIDMVDISDKDVVPRFAEAEGEILLRPDTLEKIRRGEIKKGDVLATAEVAGIQAAKRTHELIPLCHQIPLSKVKILFDVREDRIAARCLVKAEYKTGVEMEALVGATVALLTVWDMVKYLEKDEAGQYPLTRLSGVKVLKKEKRI